MTPTTPREWFEALDAARENHFGQDRTAQWKTLAQYYRAGSAHSKSFRGQDIDYATQPADYGETTLRVNVMQAIVENFVAALVPDKLHVTAVAKRNGGEKAAKIVEAFFNNDVAPNSGLDDAIDRVASSMSIYGPGILKLGFTLTPRNSGGLPEDGIPDLPYTVQAGGDVEDEDDAAIQSESMWYSVVQPWNFVPAAGSLRLNECPYVFEKIRKRLSDVQASGLYENTGGLHPYTLDDDKWRDSSNGYEEMLVQRSSEDVEGPSDDYIDIIEVWDIRSQKFYALAAGEHEKYLRNEGWPFDGMDGYPYVLFGAKHDPEAFYPLSVLWDVTPLQDELNAASSIMIETMRSSTPFLVYDSNALDSKEARKLAKAGVNEMVPLNLDSGQQLKDVVMQFPTGQFFSPDLYGVRNMIIQSILLLTGQSDFLMGQSQRTKSATEVAATSQSYSNRMQYKRKLFRRSLSEVVKKSYQILRNRVEEPRWVRTTGMGGYPMAQMKPEDLKSEIDISLSIDSVETYGGDPVRLKTVTQAMAPFLQSPDLAMLGGLNIPKFVRTYLEASGLKNLDEVQPGAGDPISPEDENILLLDGVILEPHPMDDDEEHVRQHIEIQGLAGGKATIIQDHINKHIRNIMIKQTVGQNGGAGAAGGAGVEAPSRQTTPNMGEEAARTQQVTNQ